MTDDSTPTTGEGMSTPKKVAAGAAVGVAIPAAVTVAKKLPGQVGQLRILTADQVLRQRYHAGVDRYPIRRQGHADARVEGRIEQAVGAAAAVRGGVPDRLDRMAAAVRASRRAGGRPGGDLVRPGTGGPLARDRAAVVLCHLEGYSRREAATALGLPEGTLSSVLSRALAKLRAKLGGDHR